MPPSHFVEDLTAFLTPKSNGRFVHSHSLSATRFSNRYHSTHRYHLSTITMKNLALVSLLSGAAVATTPANRLFGRQMEPLPCDELGFPVTCCDGYSYCDINEYCTPEGCCPVGEVCFGGGDTLTDTITRTETNTFTVPVPPSSSSQPPFPTVPSSSSTHSGTVTGGPTGGPTSVQPPIPSFSGGAAANTVPRGSALGLISGLLALLV
ncbi:hypothetical protein VTO42DRAFT_3238 [Malbranchea cinnamomea]